MNKVRKTMWKPAIPISEPRALAAKGYEKAVEMAMRLREMCPESRAGVVVEDNEVQQVMIAMEDDQAKLLGLA